MGVICPSRYGLFSGLRPSGDPDPSLAASPGIDQPFDLRVGDRAFVAEANAYVRFLEVTGDSRCPSHALILCVWEGDAELQLEVAFVEGSSRLESLHTRLDPKLADLGRVVLHLDELAPYPETTTRIPAGEYVATLVARIPD